MKRLISIVLIIAILLSCNVSAYAIDDSDDYQTTSIEVEYSDNVGTIEKLTVMKTGNNVYVSAKELAERLGFTIRFDEDEFGEYVCIGNTQNASIPKGFTSFYFDSTDVHHMVFSKVVKGYKAPFCSIRNGDDAWIPFEYTLLILGSAMSIIDDTILIDIPEMSIIDIFYTVMRNNEEYNFDWQDDFGYQNLDVDIIGTSSHLTNLFNGILKFDGDSWVELFQAFANDSSSYDSKYGEDLALLLCTESDKELAAETKKITKYKDLLSADGKIGKMLSQYSKYLDTEAEAWAKTCETILNEVQNGNSSLAQYNKAYQALEKALDKQTWFSNTGGTILEVQKGVQDAIPFLNAALTVLEIVGYGEEFKNQDEFSVDAVSTALSNLGEESLIFEAMKTSMLDYTENLQTNVIAYSTKRYFDENIDSWIKKALGITELLGTQANIELLAWSLVSSFVPRLSDSLSAADKFELALYASVFSSGMFLAYQDVRDDVFYEEENITAENLYTVSQYCYTYLKSCYITRDAAIASLKGKTSSVQEQIQPLIDEQNAINKEIAELLIILKDANKTNDGLVYGFLLSDNNEYLSSYDPSVLVAVLENVDFEMETNKQTQSAEYEIVRKVTFDHRFTDDYQYEYAIITGKDDSDSEVWSITTDLFECADSDVISEVGTNNGVYYYDEFGTIVALNLADGIELWRNSDFGGSAAAADFDDDGNIYICSYHGPDFFAVDENGNTLAKIVSFETDYFGAYEIEYLGDQVAVTLEWVPIASVSEAVFCVNLDDYSYFLNSLNSEIYISVEEAVNIVSKYYGIQTGEVDEETGYLFGYFVYEQPTEANPTYAIALRWLVNDHWSTLGVIYIDALNGCIKDAC